MKAAIIEEVRSISDDREPVVYTDLPNPKPGPGEILLHVSVCGVCHTELDEIEGRARPPKLPIIPGHQVVGKVTELGLGAKKFRPGDRVGVGWIYHACGRCLYCLSDRENLCPEFLATGRDRHGGYAEFMTVPEDFALPIPEGIEDIFAAPLMCAGAIGYRSLKLTNIKDGDSLGLTGFGASAHLVLQAVRYLYPRTKVFVFARSESERQFAKDLGAFWTGDTTDEPPNNLEAIIDTTPAWFPVMMALRFLAPGGRLVINAIRKEASDQHHLMEIDYPRDLWMEKEIKSVANVTRKDIGDFLQLAARIDLKPEVQVYSLKEAGLALRELKARKIRGAKVLKIV
ncbi:MAG: zinc-dependent alcohol dehydrogenase family protein [Syntrophales bacterium]|nr:zinc-dependent alcohol dehydrogenase family protein [Syntrophales bacterium]